VSLSSTRTLVVARAHYPCGVRRLILLLLVAVAAGCGSTKTAAPPTTTTVPSPTTALPGTHALYAGGNWAVLLRGSDAVAAHLVQGRWRLDRSGRVKIEILGPAPGSTAPKLPQIAAQLTAPAPMIESGLWVDGKELIVKGGGTPTEGTIYGAPAKPLAAGKHIAVAYGRTDRTGTARAWSFTTP
jgi:hypothetical protein